MKRAFLFAFAAAAMLVLAGCVTMSTEEDCENINPSEVLEQTSWGENFVSTDDAVVLKAKLTCWHSKALAYAAKGDEEHAVGACRSILNIPDDPGDSLSEYLLQSEYNMCIDSVAGRMRNDQICYEIPAESAYERTRCFSHAAPRKPICASPFILLALGLPLFLRFGIRRNHVNGDS